MLGVPGEDETGNGKQHHEQEEAAARETGNGVDEGIADTGQSDEPMMPEHAQAAEIMRELRAECAGALTMRLGRVLFQRGGTRAWQ